MGRKFLVKRKMKGRDTFASSYIPTLTSNTRRYSTYPCPHVQLLRVMKCEMWSMRPLYMSLKGAGEI